MSLVAAIGLTLFTLVLSHPVLAQSCAMCGSAFTDPNDPTARAFNWSILMLIAAPYLMTGSIGGWLVYKHWRARTQRRAGQLIYLVPSQKEESP